MQRTRWAAATCLGYAALYASPGGFASAHVTPQAATAHGQNIHPRLDIQGIEFLAHL
jgi:hypothetical protein